MDPKSQESPASQPYLHGFSAAERERLHRQARIVEQRVHERIDLCRVRCLLEVGSGVGAQSEILLRRWPDMNLVCVEANADNLAAAREHLDGLGEWAQGRYRLELGDAARLELEPGMCDGAFLCWILEHVPDPAQVLAEVRRVLRPGSPVVVTEVQNASFFLSPYSPRTLAYWSAFNAHQYDLGGDPFVGAKLGNLLQRVGYHDIRAEVRPILLDNRAPAERAEFIEYWSELLLSGAPGLIAEGRVTPDDALAMRAELRRVAHDPDAVFFYAFVQASARVE